MKYQFVSSSSPASFFWLFMLVLASVAIVGSASHADDENHQLRGRRTTGAIAQVADVNSGLEAALAAAVNPPNNVQSPTPMVWDEDFMKTVQLATHLNHLVKTDDLFEKIDQYKTEYPTFVAYDDGFNDGALVVKSNDGVCYALFRSQERHNIWDLIQTINPFVKRNVYGTNCDVRQSFYNGYETNYANDFRTEVEACVQSCGDDKQCKLVLGGNSSGGSIATVASLDPFLKQFNPTVLTWGPIRAIVNEECTDIDSKNIYRFVTGNAGYYDAIIDSSPKMGKHVGHMILLDEMSQAIYIGLDDNQARFPDNYNIHDIETYLGRIDDMANLAPSFPIVLDTGFGDGHWCTKDDECKSSCIAGACRSSAGVPVMLQTGSTCSRGNECESGTCKEGRCTELNGLLAVGSPCKAHGDCASLRCAFGNPEEGELNYCLPKRYTFGWCNVDEDCLSGYCGVPPTSWSWFSFNSKGNPQCLERPTTEISRQGGK